MPRFPSRPFVLRAAVCLSALLLAQTLYGQTTTRPGGAARGNARTGTTNTGARNAASGANANGPRQYRSNTLLGDAIVEVDPETRSLVIVTDEDTHREMMKVVADLDRPKPQVLIKVVFVEVTWNKGYDVGVEGSYTFNLENPVSAINGTRVTNTTSSNTNGTGTTTTTNTVLNETLGTAARAAETAAVQSLFGLASATDGTFLRFVTDDWSATLRAMATHGKVEVLSRPSIMARNNQEAVIVVGQEVPFITESRETALGQTVNTIRYDNVGIILRVTPFITANNTVEMIVAPEISNLSSQTVPISSTVNAPIITKRSAETVVVTPNGSTAVIGGLMETQRLETTRKIPLLGDIPLIGAAFRRTVKDDVKRELLIFLTPCIINDPAQVEQYSGKALESTELINKAFNETDFTKFFDENCPPEEAGKNVMPASPEIRRALPTNTAPRVETISVSEKVTTRTPQRTR